MDHTRARRRAAVVTMTVLAAAALAACGGGSGDGTTTTVDRSTPDDSLRLNEIQVIGTHNSFHVEPPADELQLLSDMDPEAAEERSYGHPPLGDQLDEQRIRQIELDIFADSQGGLFANPVMAGPDATPDPAMLEPGTKVLHEQDVDYHSNCLTLVACLEEVKAWSDANPDHVPIAINLQFKDGPLIFPVADQAVPEKWTTLAMDGLDDEIRSVFDEDQIITPDDVRSAYTSLEQAVQEEGWPTLKESRGKVMFLMVNPEPYRSLYLEGHDLLKGRVMFTNSEPGEDDAAFIGRDDPVADGDEIRDLVEQGYLVRTRADADGVEPEAGDTDRLEAALASGAQFISTDYPGPDGAQEKLGTDYVAQLPGFLPARCNPVTAPEGCVDERVEPTR